MKSTGETYATLLALHVHSYEHLHELEAFLVQLVLPVCVCVCVCYTCIIVKVDDILVHVLLEMDIYV